MTTGKDEQFCVCEEDGGVDCAWCVANPIGLRSGDAQDQDCAKRPCACACHSDAENPGPHLVGCAWANEAYEPRSGTDILADIDRAEAWAETKHGMYTNRERATLGHPRVFLAALSKLIAEVRAEGRRSEAARPPYHPELHEAFVDLVDAYVRASGGRTTPDQMRGDVRSEHFHAIEEAAERMVKGEQPRTAEASPALAEAARELLEWNWEEPEHLDWTEVRVDIANLRRALDVPRRERAEISGPLSPSGVHVTEGGTNMRAAGEKPDPVGHKGMAGTRSEEQHHEGDAGQVLSGRAAPVAGSTRKASADAGSPFSIQGSGNACRVFVYHVGLYPSSTREDAERLLRSLEHERARRNAAVNAELADLRALLARAVELFGGDAP